MNKIEKALLALAFIFTGLVFFQVHTGTTPFGSVVQNSSYHSTTTRAFNGNAIANGQLIQSGSGDLGSVVITGAGTGIITIYDATSTVTNRQLGTTTLATFPASTAAGTYQFDSQYYYGLVIETSGSVATSTITYR